MEKILFKTIAEFKREAQAGRFMKGGFFGTTRPKEEWREITGTQSNDLRLKTTRDGKTFSSFFDFPKASDSEIADGVLKIYEERIKVGNSDIPANTSWIKWEIERGTYKESELIRYRKQVAEYELAK